MKHTLGTKVGAVIDWSVAHWFKVSLALCAVSVAYETHVFVHRFLAFSGYVYEQMEKRNAVAVTPVEPGTVD